MYNSHFREPENIHETLKMYKLQTIQGSNTTLSRQSTEQQLNSIETVETVTCNISDQEKEKEACFC